MTTVLAHAKPPTPPRANRSHGDHQAPGAGKAHFCYSSIALLAALLAGNAYGASLQGTVTAQGGSPLEKVPVCLRVSDTQRVCAKTQSTDRLGNYRFNGLKAGQQYQVAILQSDSAPGRKFERYRTYVWEPLQQSVTVTSKNQTLDLEQFSGKFNFSNFQRGLTLTGADFPELRSIDLLSAYVALKVYLPPTDADAVPETIFLGQVTDPDKLKVSASVPLATSAIAYQIYSAELNINGIISLGAGQ